MMHLCSGGLSAGWILGLIIAGIVLLTALIIILTLVPFKLWFRAFVSSAYISMFKLIGMKLRKVDCQLITLNYITAKKAGLKITVDELETHVMAGGNVENVVKALVAAYSANIDLTSQKAKAIDLAGRDVYEAVKNTVVPKITSPTTVSTLTFFNLFIKSLSLHRKYYTIFA